MNKQSPYYKQVLLLIRLIPLVEKETCFALKGGTAINLFVRDFPRLSVDIDLAYLPLEPREIALANVRNALAGIAANINKIPDLNAVLQDNKPDEMRIIVEDHSSLNRGTQIKIEVSPVARGTLLPPVKLDVVASVENEFGFASMKVVSLPDLYGGKLCAALDRQHPRDLFDIKILLENQKIDREIFNGFLTYLLSHKRPISEIMNPRWKDITLVFDREFKGMTVEPVTLEELTVIPGKMIQSLKENFTQQDYEFLVSFKKGEPEWSLACSDQIQYLPAVQWKLLNIRKMPKQKLMDSVSLLQKTMEQWLK
ncbi:nucleotidyl transferase AbiEii/AbiGii toxin family protein [Legionella pneumophila]|uniref:nucleotidyl transferase AbiEii/AbiGii toxin family protein n=1 Tax=Legionella pneumophila TaxID=446 RepID=UPI001A27BE4D|nr:nucleotidyl transferase AbiEii/AbiGii toxin family protein [Legionella pneumophila]HAT1860643.1 nucleotidyl transferase AbiEii/AbiGii toxin family protein [Legionella pneumophila]HAU1297271.1 nucleotidyl transferase AbiEii/AbiGii toxin family protein [Legionella pneumophila]HAU2155596.1 nucleotidyl transferase AbiEii/AbiGii toxin family protein [Legionella pneumophila]